MPNGFFVRIIFEDKPVYRHQVPGFRHQENSHHKAIRIMAVWLFSWYLAPDAWSLRHRFVYFNVFLHNV